MTNIGKKVEHREHDAWISEIGIAGRGRIGVKEPRGNGEVEADTGEDKDYSNDFWRRKVMDYFGNVSNKYNLDVQEAIEKGWITTDGILTKEGEQEIRRRELIKIGTASAEIMDRLVDGAGRRKRGEQKDSLGDTIKMLLLKFGLSGLKVKVSKERDGYEVFKPKTDIKFFISADSDLNDLGKIILRYTEHIEK